MTPLPKPEEIDLFRLPVLEQSWLLPKTARAAKGNLVYTFSDAKCRGDEGMLTRFIALADSDDEGIESYALEFGVLGLCMHGIPWQWRHEDGKVCSEPLREDYERARAVHAKGRSPARPSAFREPLDAWRHLARAFAAALGVADRIRSGRPSDPEQFRLLATFLPNNGYTRASDMPGAASATAGRIDKAQMEWDQWCLGDAMTELLDRAVRATLEFTDDRGEPRAKMRFAGRSLLDALSLQLAMAICRTDDAATCDGCGKVFVPSSRYKPRAGQRRFCPACRADGVPQKLATRDRRARSRLSGEGQ